MLCGILIVTEEVPSLLSLSFFLSVSQVVPACLLVRPGVPGTTDLSPHQRVLTFQQADCLALSKLLASLHTRPQVPCHCPHGPSLGYLPTTLPLCKEALSR